MTFEINTSIKINATPKKVWDAFTRFDNLQNWNNFLKKVDGEIAKGNTINITVDNMKFKPKVLSYIPKKEFIWKGKLLLPKIFDGTHQFLFKENKDGTTTFEQNESFIGILIPFLKNKLNNEVKPKFEKMNVDLKNHVENNL